MSYISISTNQPSEGQRELTERQPANLRNDFKVPIEIHNGDTIELVSLKFNIGSIVINTSNNKLVWSVGKNPFSTYHCALIPIGNYDNPEQLADAIAVAFNSSTLLPSYQKETLVNPYGFTNIPGWTCVWTAPVVGVAPKVGFFTIKANQCEGPGDKTNGTIANAIFAAEVGSDPVLARFLADGYAVNNYQRYASQLPSLGGIPKIDREQTITTSAAPEVQTDAQVFSQKKWDILGTEAEELAINMFALATDETTAAIEEFGLVGEPLDGFGFFFGGESNQIGNTGGHSFETSRIANSLIVESQLALSVDGIPSTILGDLGGIYNNGGVIRCEVHPLIGFNTIDFTTSTNALANFIGQTVRMEIQGWDAAGNIAPKIRNFLVAAHVPSATNGWCISLTAGGGFDASGQDGPAIDTVLWMANITDLVDAGTGANLETYSNGMFALGYTEGGGASPPPTANDRDNHNAFADPANGRARNYWYYDTDAQHFKCAFRQAINDDTPGITDEDEYTRPVRTPFCINGVIESPLKMFNPGAPGAGEVKMDIQPTQPLGYPACKIGLNRRARITEDYINHNPNEFAGFTSFSDPAMGNPYDEACEYSISINNGEPGPPGPNSVEIDAGTKARIPIIKIVNPKAFQRFEGIGNTELGEKLPPIGDKGWIESNVAKIGRWTDSAVWAGIGAFDPTKSIVLEIRVDRNNEIKYSIGLTGATTVVSANPFPIKPVITGAQEYGLPITTSDNDTGVRLMESHYPLIPLIQCGGGGYYGISGPTGITGVNEERIGAAYTIDMSGPYRLPDQGKTQVVPRLSFKDAYPDTAINQEFAHDASDRIEDTTTTIASNATAAMKQIVQRTTGFEKNRESLLFYNHGPSVPVAGPEANLFIENAQCIRDLRANTTGTTGMAGLAINVISPAVSTSTEFDSKTKINLTAVVETGISVNILSGNIKGYNGGTSDINKAVCFLQPEQLEATTDGAVRTLFHESKTSRPVEFNVPNTQITQSMTVQLKNGNNELITGIEAPVEVILYKKSKDKEIEKIRAVLEGMKSDRQESKIQNAGINNPLLGVIPR